MIDDVKFLEEFNPNNPAMNERIAKGMVALYETYLMFKASEFQKCLNMVANEHLKVLDDAIWGVMEKTIGFVPPEHIMLEMRAFMVGCLYGMKSVAAEVVKAETEHVADGGANWGRKAANLAKAMIPARTKFGELIHKFIGDDNLPFFIYNALTNVQRSQSVNYVVHSLMQGKYYQGDLSASMIQAACGVREQAFKDECDAEESEDILGEQTAALCVMVGYMNGMGTAIQDILDGVLSIKKLDNPIGINIEWQHKLLDSPVDDLEDTLEDLLEE